MEDYHEIKYSKRNQGADHPRRLHQMCIRDRPIPDLLPQECQKYYQTFRMLRAAGTQIIIISMRLSTVVVKICTFNFQSVLGILQMSFVLFAIESISFIQRKWVKKIGSGVAHLRQKRYPSMQICLGKQFLQFWILAWLRFLLLKQS